MGIKPDAYRHMGTLISEVWKCGFVISQMKMAKLSSAQAAEFYAEQKGQPHFRELCDFMASDVILAMELVGDNAISAWRDRMGATEATANDPTSFRKMFGTDAIKNAVHGSTSITGARNEIAFFFERDWPTTACFNNCTCAVIRPDATRRRDRRPHLERRLRDQRAGAHVHERRRLGGVPRGVQGRAAGVPRHRQRDVLWERRRDGDPAGERGGQVPRPRWPARPRDRAALAAEYPARAVRRGPREERDPLLGPPGGWTPRGGVLL